MPFTKHQFRSRTIWTTSPRFPLSRPIITWTCNEINNTFRKAFLVSLPSLVSPQFTSKNFAITIETLTVRDWLTPSPLQRIDERFLDSDSRNEFYAKLSYRKHVIDLLHFSFTKLTCEFSAYRKREKFPLDNVLWQYLSIKRDARTIVRVTWVWDFKCPFFQISEDVWTFPFAPFSRGRAIPAKYSGCAFSYTPRLHCR